MEPQKSVILKDTGELKIFLDYTRKPEETMLNISAKPVGWQKNNYRNNLWKLGMVVYENCISFGTGIVMYPGERTSSNRLISAG